jgi:hypothetical protein
MDSPVFVNCSQNFKYDKNLSSIDSLFSCSYIKINLSHYQDDGYLSLVEEVTLGNEKLMGYFIPKNSNINVRFETNIRFRDLIENDPFNNETDTWFNLINKAVSEAGFKKYFYDKLDLEDYEQLDIIFITLSEADSINIIFQKQENIEILK